MYFPVEMARIAQFYACYGFNKFLVWFIISALADQEVIFTQAEMIFISDRRKELQFRIISSRHMLPDALLNFASNSHRTSLKLNESQQLEREILRN